MKVIVIGSGIVGASAAYNLAKKNIEVVIVDKKQDGKATSAGAGIVCPWASSDRGEAWYQIAKNGARLYSSLISDLEGEGESEVGYKKVGALCVSSVPAELDAIEKEVKLKKEEAPEIGDVLRLNSQETKNLFPPLKEGLEAVFISGAARVDGSLLRDALTRAAKKNGAKIISGEATLLHENNKVIGVKVNKEIIYADSVLLTAGAWTPSLLEPLGIYLNLEPQRGQIAHIKLLGEDTSNWPVILPQSSHYMLAFDDSRIVAGATRETGSGFDFRKTVGGVHEVISEALEIAPGLSSGTLEEMRIGFRPMGPDLLPLLGKIESINGLVLATGLGASGLTIGPYVGVLAATIITESNLDTDLSIYNPMRAISLKAKV